MLCLLSHTCDLTNQILINSGFYVFLLKQNTAQTVSDNSANNFLGGKGKGLVVVLCVYTWWLLGSLIVSSCRNTALFFACFFYFRGSLIGTTNLLSLYLNRIKKVFFLVLFFENKFGIFFCPEQHRFLLSLCVCLLLAPMLILPIVWYLFLRFFKEKK